MKTDRLQETVTQVELKHKCLTYPKEDYNLQQVCTEINSQLTKLLKIKYNCFLNLL